MQYDLQNAHDLSTTLPSHEAMVLHTSIISEFGMLYLLLIPLVVPLAFSDSFFLDQRDGLLPLAIARGVNKRRYIVSKALVCVVVGFVITVLPLLINWLLSALAFPYFAPREFTNAQSSTENLVNGWNYMWFQSLYPERAHSVIFICMMLTGLYGAISALCAYAAAMFVKHSRAIIVGCMFIFFNVAAMLLNTLRNMRIIGNYNTAIHTYFLIGEDSNKYPSGVVVIFWALLLVGSIYIIALQSRKKDVL